MKVKHKFYLLLLPILAFIYFVPLVVHSLAQGPLAPTGAPAPTMKTLNQVEPRIPIGQADAPLTISAPGSYYFTSDLKGVAASAGITISSDDVTLDLMGFTLRGVPGSLEGIDVPATNRNITIRNGVVRDWGLHGVDASNSQNSSLENLKAYANGLEGTSQDGLRIGINSRVTDCQAENSQSGGIRTGLGCTIAGSTAHQNGTDGIATSHGSTITDSVASQNGDDGIATGSGCNITDATAYLNGGEGIVTGAACKITDAAAYNNGEVGIATSTGCVINRCAVSFNMGDGIQVSADCAVVGNTCDSNGFLGDGAGIHATGSDNRIDGNHVTDNDRGIDVDLSGSLIVRNSASGNAINYDVAANNKVGVIVSAPNSGAILGSTGGAGVGSTDPWANISF